jgi:predicted DNA binding CopG/RHH family protein
MNEANYLDAEEQTMIESLENDGWTSVGNLSSGRSLEEWKTHLSKAASNTTAKDQRMNIRITKNDMDSIKAKAIEEGIPYQTLVAGIIHKYITGRLGEKHVS